MNKLFEITEDGSHTLFVPQLNEHYHSTHGAIQEALHVYIDAGLKQCVKHEVNVLEVGFGTGLNTFLTLCAMRDSSKTVHYTGLELYPLSLSEAEHLNYAELIDKKQSETFMTLHQAPWGMAMPITPDFSLTKIRCDVSREELSFAYEGFDVVYFDAFAPDKQPEMWTQAIFDKIYSVCNPQAVLTTYCAKGVVRRMLQEAGFTVERLPGPAGKREILRGKK